MNKFEQGNLENFDTLSDKEFKFEMALTPEAETDFEKSKNILAEIWPDLTGAEEIKDKELDNLTSEDYRRLLYEKMIPSLDRTMESLGISANKEMLSTERNLSDGQLKMIKSLEKQFKDISVGGKLKETEKGERKDATWSFYPKEIVKNQSVNCSGASLLFGRMTERLGIKTYQAVTPNHSFNIFELADKRLVYVDTRVNSEHDDEYTDSIRSFVIDKYEKNKLNGAEIIRIEGDNSKHFQRKALLLPQYEAVASIINNFGALKSEAAQLILPEEAVAEIENSSDEGLYNHPDNTKIIARNIFEEKKDVLSKLNFSALDHNLCGDIRDLEEEIGDR